MVFRYIKRLVVFALCLFLFFLSYDILPLFITIPLILLSFAFLHSRITGENPPYLFAFYRTDAYFRKGGLRDLLRIFVTLFGFIYDTIIWIVWSTYLIFILFVDLLDLIRTVFYWIIHAIVWFLSLYIPFLIFLYRIFLHYLIRWPWWLYQIAFFNIRNSFNRNFYRIAFWGTLQASIIIFLFYYLEIILDLPGITYIGIIISLLPLTWSFGEIACVRVNKLENEPWHAVKSGFQNGLESVRSILFYLTLFVLLLITQLGLNLFGWLPSSGLIIAGFMFNINTLISLLLIFLCVIIILGVMIIPSYRLYTRYNELRLSQSFELLKFMGKKVIQYLLVLIPSSIFSLIVVTLPVIVVLIAGTISYNLKNSVAEVRINHLRSEQAAISNPDSAYLIEKKIENLKSLMQFPLNLKQEIKHRSILDNELLFATEDLRSLREDQIKSNEQFNSKMANLQKEIKQMGSDTSVDAIEEEKSKLQSEFSRDQETAKKEFVRLKTDILALNQKRNQLPILFFLAGLWLVIFGSLALAFGIAYFGNVFHQLFLFRNNNNSSEWAQSAEDIRESDHKQPLLGGTLFIITVFLIYLLIKTISTTNAVIMSIPPIFPLFD
jgi:hypothetical protein